MLLGMVFRPPPRYIRYSLTYRITMAEDELPKAVE
jgi:hypothetical protein